MTDPRKFYVTVEQTQTITYQVEADTAQLAERFVETAPIEQLDEAEIHMETSGATITNVEKVEPVPTAGEAT